MYHVGQRPEYRRKKAAAFAQRGFYKYAYFEIFLN